MGINRFENKSEGINILMLIVLKHAKCTIYNKFKQ